MASQVEGLTRQHRVDLLITEEVRGKLGERFRLRRLRALAVKGKTDPVVTFLVEGPAAGGVGSFGERTGRSAPKSSAT